MGTAHMVLSAQKRTVGFWLSWKDLLTIDATFVLFIFSGRYKNFPELRRFPFDFTLTFLAVTIVLIAFGVASHRLKLPPLRGAVVAFLLFSELAVASLFWSSLGPLNIDKLQRFTLLTAVSFFIATMLGQNPERRCRVLRLTAWLSTAIVVYYFFYRYVLGTDAVDAAAISSGRVPPDADTYLEYSAHACILFITFIVTSAFGVWGHLWIGIVGAMSSLFALSLIGGRGSLAAALLSVPLASVALLMRQHAGTAGLARIAVLIASLSGIALVIVTSASAGGKLNELQFRTLDRYALQLSNEDTSSMDERAHGRSLAMQMWLERPVFGWGIGEFRAYDSDLMYPHNLALEILMELGLIGGALFAAVVAGAVVGCIRIARYSGQASVDVTIAILFLTELASHLTVQGYLAEDRIFFSYMGLILGGISGIRMRAV